MRDRNYKQIGSSNVMQDKCIQMQNTMEKNSERKRIKLNKTNKQTNKSVRRTICLTCAIWSDQLNCRFKPQNVRHFFQAAILHVIDVCRQRIFQM